MSEHPKAQKRRIRLVYSKKDIQLALSAADFLLDCDPNDRINKVELRRYKCFETTAIVAYSRPFSASHGGVPKLSMKMIGIRLDDQEQALHDKIISLRNKVVAHSDSEMMRIVVSQKDLDIGNGLRMPFIQTAFDEGLEFVGFGPVTNMLCLFHRVYAGIFETLLEDAARNPDSFNFRHDYLDPEN